MLPATTGSTKIPSSIAVEIVLPVMANPVIPLPCAPLYTAMPEPPTLGVPEDRIVFPWIVTRCDCPPGPVVMTIPSYGVEVQLLFATFTSDALLIWMQNTESYPVTGDRVQVIVLPL